MRLSVFCNQTETRRLLHLFQFTPVFNSAHLSHSAFTGLLLPKAQALIISKSNHKFWIMAKFVSMKLLFHKAFSVVLALLVLVSTLSLTIEKHYCADQLVDIAVLGQVKSCCGTTAPAGLFDSDDSGCCKNEIEVLIGQDELNLAEKQLVPFESQLFVTSITTSLEHLVSLRRAYKPSYDDYTPPLISKDLYLFHEVYLI